MFLYYYFFLHRRLKNQPYAKKNLEIEKYEINIYNEIKEKLENSQCAIFKKSHHEFLNGLVRTFKPKKIVEIGPEEGGNSMVILNAIKDIDNSHLYSFDNNNNDKVGLCIKEFFPTFLGKWTLYRGDIPSKYLEDIGKDINMVVINSYHFNPEAILNFIIILPFLKNNCIICFIDKSEQINQFALFKKRDKNEYSLIKLLNLIRGKIYYPTRNRKNSIRDIGAIRLDKNQMDFVHDYFRKLIGKWDYLPSETAVNIIKELFKNYYDKECLDMFEKAISLNSKE